MKSFPWMGIIGLVLVLGGCAIPKSTLSSRTGLIDRLKKQDQFLGWRWPLDQIRITSPFGQRGHEFHEGIDLRAMVGTPVFAAASGRIIYADQEIQGYGKLVMIRHPGGVVSIYAHNSDIFVHRGQEVLRGQKIAISGKSGRVTGPHLHFEVRKGLIAFDPVPILGIPPSHSLALIEKSAIK